MLYFFTFTVGYLIGCGTCPLIFKFFKDEYRKTLIVVSFGILLWMMGNLFHYTLEADKNDYLNDDGYSFVPRSSILGSHFVL